MVKKIFAAIVVVSCTIAFTACMGFDEPYYKYEIYGQVVNEQNEPIKGIQVDFQEGRSGSIEKTNKDGYYRINAIAATLDTLSLLVTDIDGNLNGEYNAVWKQFSSEDLAITPKADGKKPLLYKGDAKVEINFVLTKK